MKAPEVYSQAVQILKLLLWTDGPVCIQCFIPPMMWSRQNVYTFTKQHSSLSKDAGATSGLAALPSAPEIAMVTRDNLNSSWKWQVCAHYQHDKSGGDSQNSAMNMII